MPDQFTPPDFIKGMDLCQRFYAEAVAPILARHLPQVPHSAARIGPGSDVLGFDTPTSMDHDWGPRVTLFLSEPDLRACGQQVEDVLRRELPREIGGFATFFAANEDGTVRPQGPDGDAVDHGVDCTTPAAFFEGYIGRDPALPLGEKDWLAFPPQHLRTVASGRIFHDGLGQLETARQRLGWYPHDLWLYLVANQWRRIDQEAPFLGRCGDVGDELGSHLVACRMITELMRLCFLMEKAYPPYFKWFGTAFSLLDCADELASVFRGVLASAAWRERERHMSQAYLIVSRMHDLGLTPSKPPEVTPFYGRPYLVPHAGRFVEALHEAISSPAVKSLPPNAGAVWQFTDSTDILSGASACRSLATIHGK